MNRFVRVINDDNLRFRAPLAISPLPDTQARPGQTESSSPVLDIAQYWQNTGTEVTAAVAELKHNADEQTTMQLDALETSLFHLQTAFPGSDIDLKDPKTRNQWFDVAFANYFDNLRAGGSAEDIFQELANFNTAVNKLKVLGKDHAAALLERVAGRWGVLTNLAVAEPGVDLLQLVEKYESGDLPTHLAQLDLTVSPEQHLQHMAESPDYAEVVNHGLQAAQPVILERVAGVERPRDLLIENADFLQELSEVGAAEDQKGTTPAGVEAIWALARQKSTVLETLGEMDLTRLHETAQDLAATEGVRTEVSDLLTKMYKRTETGDALRALLEGQIQDLARSKGEKSAELRSKLQKFTELSLAVDSSATKKNWLQRFAERFVPKLDVERDPVGLANEAINALFHADLDAIAPEHRAEAAALLGELKNELVWKALVGISALRDQTEGHAAAQVGAKKRLGRYQQIKAELAVGETSVAEGFAPVAEKGAVAEAYDNFTKSGRALQFIAAARLAVEVVELGTSGQTALQTLTEGQIEEPLGSMHGIAKADEQHTLASRAATDHPLMQARVTMTDKPISETLTANVQTEETPSSAGGKPLGMFRMEGEGETTMADGGQPTLSDAVDANHDGIVDSRQVSITGASGEAISEDALDLIWGGFHQGDFTIPAGTEINGRVLDADITINGGSFYQAAIAEGFSHQDIVSILNSPSTLVQLVQANSGFFNNGPVELTLEQVKDIENYGIDYDLSGAAGDVENLEMSATASSSAPATGPDATTGTTSAPDAATTHETTPAGPTLEDWPSGVVGDADGDRITDEFEVTMTHQGQEVVTDARAVIWSGMPVTDHLTIPAGTYGNFVLTESITIDPSGHNSVYSALQAYHDQQEVLNGDADFDFPFSTITNALLTDANLAKKFVASNPDFVAISPTVDQQTAGHAFEAALRSVQAQTGQQIFVDSGTEATPDTTTPGVVTLADTDVTKVNFTVTDDDRNQGVGTNTMNSEYTLVEAKLKDIGLNNAEIYNPDGVLDSLNNNNGIALVEDQDGNTWAVMSIDHDSGTWALGEPHSGSSIVRVQMPADVEPNAANLQIMAAAIEDFYNDPGANTYDGIVDAANNATYNTTTGDAAPPEGESGTGGTTALQPLTFENISTAGEIDEQILIDNFGFTAEQADEVEARLEDEATREATLAILNVALDEDGMLDGNAEDNDVLTQQVYDAIAAVDDASQTIVVNQDTNTIEVKSAGATISNNGQIFNQGRLVDLSASSVEFIQLSNDGDIYILEAAEGKTLEGAISIGGEEIVLENTESANIHELHFIDGKVTNIAAEEGQVLVSSEIVQINGSIYEITGTEGANVSSIFLDLDGDISSIYAPANEVLQGGNISVGSSEVSIAVTDLNANWIAFSEVDGSVVAIAAPSEQTLHDTTFTINDKTYTFTGFEGKVAFVQFNSDDTLILRDANSQYVQQGSNPEITVTIADAAPEAAGYSFTDIRAADVQILSGDMNIASGGAADDMLSSLGINNADEIADVTERINANSGWAMINIGTAGNPDMQLVISLSGDNQPTTLDNAERIIRLDIPEYDDVGAANADAALRPIIEIVIAQHEAGVTDFNAIQTAVNEALGVTEAEPSGVAVPISPTNPFTDSSGQVTQTSLATALANAHVPQAAAAAMIDIFIDESGNLIEGSEQYLAVAEAVVDHYVANLNDGYDNGINEVVLAEEIIPAITSTESIIFLNNTEGTIQLITADSWIYPSDWIHLSEDGIFHNGQQFTISGGDVREIRINPAGQVTGVSAGGVTLIDDFQINGVDYDTSGITGSNINLIEFSENGDPIYIKSLDGIEWSLKGTIININGHQLDITGVEGASIHALGFSESGQVNRVETAEVLGMGTLTIGNIKIQVNNVGYASVTGIVFDETGKILELSGKKDGADFIYTDLADLANFDIDVTINEVEAEQTATPAPTNTPAATATDTPATNTPVAPTPTETTAVNTPTPEANATAAPTNTPTPTITATATASSTHTPEATGTPSPPNTLTPTVTIAADSSVVQLTTGDFGTNDTINAGEVETALADRDLPAAAVEAFINLLATQGGSEYLEATIAVINQYDANQHDGVVENDITTEELTDAIEALDQPDQVVIVNDSGLTVMNVNAEENVPQNVFTADSRIFVNGDELVMPDDSNIDGVYFSSEGELDGLFTTDGSAIEDTTLVFGGHSIPLTGVETAGINVIRFHDDGSIQALSSYDGINSGTVQIGNTELQITNNANVRVVWLSENDGTIEPPLTALIDTMLTGNFEIISTTTDQTGQQVVQTTSITINKAGIAKLDWGAEGGFVAYDITGNEVPIDWNSDDIVIENSTTPSAGPAPETESTIDTNNIDGMAAHWGEVQWGEEPADDNNRPLNEQEILGFQNAESIDALNSAGVDRVKNQLLADGIAIVPVQLPESFVAGVPNRGSYDNEFDDKVIIVAVTENDNGQGFQIVTPENVAQEVQFAVFSIVYHPEIRNSDGTVNIAEITDQLAAANTIADVQIPDSDEWVSLVIAANATPTPEPGATAEPTPVAAEATMTPEAAEPMPVPDVTTEPEQAVQSEDEQSYTTLHQPDVADTIVVNSSETVADELNKQNHISKSEVDAAVAEIEANGGWMFDKEKNGDLVIVIDLDGNLVTKNIADSSSVYLVTVKGVDQAQFNEAQIPWILEQIDSDTIPLKREVQDTMAIVGSVLVIPTLIGIDLFVTGGQKTGAVVDKLQEVAENVWANKGKIPGPRALYRAFTRLASNFPKPGTPEWEALAAKLRFLSSKQRAVNAISRGSIITRALSNRRSAVSHVLKVINTTENSAEKLTLFRKLRQTISPTQMRAEDREASFATSRMIAEQLAELPDTDDLSSEQRRYHTELLSEDDETTAYADTLSKSLKQAHEKRYQNDRLIHKGSIDLATEGYKFEDYAGKGTVKVKLAGDEKVTEIERTQMRRMLYRSLHIEHVQSKSKLGKAKFDTDKAATIFDQLVTLAEIDFEGEDNPKAKAEANVLANLDGTSLAQFAEEFAVSNDQHPLAEKLRDELARRLLNLSASIERKSGFNSDASYTFPGREQNRLGIQVNNWEIKSALDALRYIENDSRELKERFGPAAGLYVLQTIAESAVRFIPDNSTPEENLAKREQLNDKYGVWHRTFGQQYKTPLSSWSPYLQDRIASYRTTEAYVDTEKKLINDTSAQLRTEISALSSREEMASYVKVLEYELNKLESAKGTLKLTRQRDRRSLRGHRVAEREWWGSIGTALKGKTQTYTRPAREWVSDKVDSRHKRNITEYYQRNNPNLDQIIAATEGRVARVKYGTAGREMLVDMYLADNPLSKKKPGEALDELKRLANTEGVDPTLEAVAEMSVHIPHIVFNAIGKNDADTVADIELMAILAADINDMADELKTVDLPRDLMKAKLDVGGRLKETKEAIDRLSSIYNKILIPGQLSSAGVAEDDYEAKAEALARKAKELAHYTSVVYAAKQAILSGDYNPRALLTAYDKDIDLSRGLYEAEIQILTQIKQRIVFESQIRSATRPEDSQVTTIGTLQSKLDWEGDKLDMLGYANMRSIQILGSDTRYDNVSEDIRQAAKAQDSARRVKMQRYLDGDMPVPDEITLNAAAFAISSSDTAFNVIGAQFIQKHNAVSSQAGTLSVFAEVTSKKANEILEEIESVEATVSEVNERTELDRIFAPHPDSDKPGYKLNSKPEEVTITEVKLSGLSDDLKVDIVHATNPDVDILGHRRTNQVSKMDAIKANGDLYILPYDNAAPSQMGFIANVADLQFSSSGEYVIVRHKGDNNKVTVYEVADLKLDRASGAKAPKGHVIKTGIDADDFTIGTSNDGSIVVYSVSEKKVAIIGKDGREIVDVDNTFNLSGEEKEITGYSVVNGKLYMSRVGSNGERKEQYASDGNSSVILSEGKVFVSSSTSNELIDVSGSDIPAELTGVTIENEYKQGNLVSVLVAYRNVEGEVVVKRLRNKDAVAAGGQSAAAAATRQPAAVSTTLTQPAGTGVGKADETSDWLDELAGEGPGPSAVTPPVTQPASTPTPMTSSPITASAAPTPEPVDVTTPTATSETATPTTETAAPAPKPPSPEPDRDPFAVEVTESDPLAEAKQKIVRTMNGLVDGKSINFTPVDENNFPQSPVVSKHAQGMKPILMQNGSSLMLNGTNGNTNVVKVTTSEGIEQSLNLDHNLHGVVYDPWTGRVFAIQNKAQEAILLEIKTSGTAITTAVVDEVGNGGIYFGAVGNGSLAYSQGQAPFENKVLIGEQTYPAQLEHPDVLFGKFGARVKNDVTSPEFTVYRYKHQNGAIVVEAQKDLVQIVGDKFPSDRAASESHKITTMVIGLDGEVYVSMEHNKDGVNIEMMYFKLELAEEQVVAEEHKPGEAPKPEPVHFNLREHAAPDTERAIDTSLPEVKVTKTVGVLTGNSKNRYGTKAYKGLQNIQIGDKTTEEIDCQDAVVMPDGQAVAVVSGERKLIIIADEDGALVQREVPLSIDTTKSEAPDYIQVAPDGTLGLVIGESGSAKKRIITIVTNEKGTLEQVDWDLSDKGIGTIIDFHPTSANTGYVRAGEKMYYATANTSGGTEIIEMQEVASEVRLIGKMVHIGNNKFVTYSGDGKLFVLDGASATEVKLPQKVSVVYNLGADLGADPPVLYIIADNILTTYRIEFAEKTDKSQEGKMTLELPRALWADTDRSGDRFRTTINERLSKAQEHEIKAAEPQDKAEITIPGTTNPLAAGSRQVNIYWQTAIQRGNQTNEVIYSHPKSPGEHKVTFAQDIAVMDTFASPYSQTLYALTSDGNLHVILPNMSYDPEKVGQAGDVLANFGTETFQDVIQLTDQFQEGARVSVGEDGRIYVSSYDQQAGTTEIITIEKQFGVNKIDISHTVRLGRIAQIEPVFLRENDRGKHVYYVNEEGYVRVYSSLEDKKETALYSSETPVMDNNAEFRVDQNGRVIIIKQGEAWIVEPKQGDEKKGFAIAKKINLDGYKPSTLNFGLTQDGRIAFFDLSSQSVHVIVPASEKSKQAPKREPVEFDLRAHAEQGVKKAETQAEQKKGSKRRPKLNKPAITVPTVNSTADTKSPAPPQAEQTINWRANAPIVVKSNEDSLSMSQQEGIICSTLTLDTTERCSINNAQVESVVTINGQTQVSISNSSIGRGIVTDDQTQAVVNDTTVNSTNASGPDAGIRVRGNSNVQIGLGVIVQGTDGITMPAMITPGTIRHVAFGDVDVLLDIAQPQGVERSKDQIIAVKGVIHNSVTTALRRSNLQAKLTITPDAVSTTAQLWTELEPMLEVHQKTELSKLATDQSASEGGVITIEGRLANKFVELVATISTSLVQLPLKSDIIRLSEGERHVDTTAVVKALAFALVQDTEEKAPEIVQTPARVELLTAEQVGPILNSIRTVAAEVKLADIFFAKSLIGTQSLPKALREKQFGKFLEAGLNQLPNLNKFIPGLAEIIDSKNVKVDSAFLASPEGKQMLQSLIERLQYVFHSVNMAFHADVAGDQSADVSQESALLQGIIEWFSAVSNIVNKNS